MTGFIFNDSKGGQLKTRDVVQAMLDFIRADDKRTYKVTIGTDSQAVQGRVSDFVTAIVIHRVGNGGRYFWRRFKPRQGFHTIRERIVNEVLSSLEVARDFLAVAKDFGILPKFDFEIHVDVGETGKTKAMIQEVVNMIRANNFEAKTKPESYAASSVADKHINKR